LKTDPDLKNHVLLGNFHQTLDLREMHQKYKNCIRITCFV